MISNQVRRVVLKGFKSIAKIELELGKSFNYHCRLVPTSNDSLVFERETLTNGENQRERLKGGNRESLMEEMDFSEGDETGEKFPLVGVMKRWNVYHSLCHHASLGDDPGSCSEDSGDCVDAAGGTGEPLCP